MNVNVFTYQVRAYRNSAAGMTNGAPMRPNVPFTPFSLKGANPRQCAAPASERPRNAPKDPRLQRDKRAPLSSNQVNPLHMRVGGI